MSYEEVIFYFVAALTVLGALGVVLARNAVHAALFLILALLAVAGVFILLSAEFLAIVHRFICSGAGSMLILLALVATRGPGETKRITVVPFRDLGEALFRTWALPFEIASLVLLVALVGALI